jgi:hypothetical protein
VNKLRFLPVTGVLVATILTVAACGSAGSSAPAAAPSTQQTVTATAAASASTAPPSTGTTAPASSASTPAPSASASADQAEFASALAAWKNAAAANAATMGMYLQQAADDLRAADNASYSTAINQLTYLEHLPATNDTPTQQANAHTDVKALDSFFGTPGLMS